MLDGADEIKQRIQAVDDLVIRIQQAFPRRNWRKAKLPLIKLNSFLEEIDLLHVDFSEANILRSHIETAEKWAAKASKAIADRAELKVGLCIMRGQPLNHFVITSRFFKPCCRSPKQFQLR